MIDSHCHLDHEPLFSNILDVLKKTQKNLYKKKSEIIVINDNTKDKTFELIKQIY